MYKARAARQQPRLLHMNGVLTLDEQGHLKSAEDSSGKPPDVRLVYVDNWREADLKTLQGDYDPLAVARKLVPADAVMPSSAAVPAQAKNFSELWRMRRCRDGDLAAGGASLPARVVDPVAWASVQQRLAAIQERLLAGAAYQGQLPDQIKKLSDDLKPEAWVSAGKRPPLNLIGAAPRPTNAQQGAAARVGSSLEAYLKEQDPEKKKLKGQEFTRTKLIADIYALFTRPNRQMTASDWQDAQQLLGMYPPGPEGELIEGRSDAAEHGLRPSDIVSGSPMIS
jgi:hypothetical protein